MKLHIVKTHRNLTLKKQGFTLVEMLLVIVILGTLAAIVVPKLSGSGEKARIQAARTQISSFKSALEMFEVDNGYYPSGDDGLIDLVEKPGNAPNWTRPYLDSIPLDPWNNEYIYEYPGNNNEYGFDLMSMGPDGRDGTDDDITNWEN